MNWNIIVALIVTIPIVLFPVVLIWFINISGIYTMIKETTKKRFLIKKKILL